jgi:hypothetical protein
MIGNWPDTTTTHTVNRPIDATPATPGVDLHAAELIRTWQSGANDYWR